MLKHFLNNNLISSNQSGFKIGDSYINQLIAITHDKGFDDGLEIGGVFFIYLKLLTKYGMKDLFINYSLMVFVEIYSNYRNVF